MARRATAVCAVSSVVAWPAYELMTETTPATEPTPVGWLKVEKTEPR